MKASEYDLSLSHRIKALRKKLGLSQPELARHLNMSKSNYSRIENGERRINHGQLMKFVEKAKISPSEFIDLFYTPKDVQAPTFLVQELFAKLILVKEGQTEIENISFSVDEEQFMALFKNNFSRKNTNNKT